MAEAYPKPDSANDLIADLEAVVEPKWLLVEIEAMAPYLQSFWLDTGNPTGVYGDS